MSAFPPCPRCEQPVTGWDDFYSGAPGGYEIDLYRRVTLQPCEHDALIVRMLISPFRPRGGTVEEWVDPFRYVAEMLVMPGSADMMVADYIRQHIPGPTVVVS